MTKDTRGYRKAVRVIVTHGNKIALGVRYKGDGTVDYHLFPGGGIEDGESVGEAAVKEVKEEVGMLVEHPREIGHSHKYDKVHPKPERAKLYRGSEDIWVTAVFVRMDNSILGTQGDAFKFVWVTPDQAIATFATDTKRDGAHREANDSKTQAVSIFKAFIAKKPVATESFAAKPSGRLLPAW